MGKVDGNGKGNPQTSTVLDLSDFVTEVDLFSRLIEPFALVFYTVDDIRRWRFRNGTIALWLLCNFACFWVTQGAAFILASSLVIAVATLSLFQVHTQILNKLLPCKKKSIAAITKETEGGAIDTVQNFRYSLIEMHDFVVKSNEYLNYFYSILKWDAVGPSAIYHTEACVFLLSIVLCPARWNCFLFFNWFFLCHPHILKKGYKYVKENLVTRKQTSKKEVSEDPTLKERVSGEKNEKDQDLCENDTADDGDGDDEEDSSDIDMTDVVGDKSMINLDPSPSKPGMVARLMEIKKRRSQIASESCVGCNVSFASILKKRQYCRHCGYSFCNRCCYLKVARSVFGATSPAAMRETVVVCCSCHSLLVQEGGVAMDDVTDKPGQGPG